MKRNIIAVLAALLVLILAGCQSPSGADAVRVIEYAKAAGTVTAATSTAAAIPPAPTSSRLDMVVNTCGQCGTDSPVGGWESEDGRALVLMSDRSALILTRDGKTFPGKWERNGFELCLSIGEEHECYAYEQNIDAMRLDNALYIRR